MFQCSSASRKFLNRRHEIRTGRRPGRFQCSSASRKFLNARRWCGARAADLFQCSSASRKFLNRATDGARGTGIVSVLFSEPKIPQSGRGKVGAVAAPRFQCSSASRKFLNGSAQLIHASTPSRFSALQRAENSSIGGLFAPLPDVLEFQCSSASRKFLNATPKNPHSPATKSFQCSSASRKFLNKRAVPRHITTVGVSVLFSEPKIPQSAASPHSVVYKQCVSVLFSEPKIPQYPQCT